MGTVAAPDGIAFRALEVRLEFEWQRDTLGRDLFPSGLAANRANLEQFIGYVADLFHATVLDT
jgi:hypothetical protein